jgi:superfamily II DNA/RNA helicase
MINGFQEAMRDIFAQVPSDTQVCLISATMPK